jgi:hypothetical protein
VYSHRTKNQEKRKKKLDVKFPDSLTEQQIHSKQQKKFFLNKNAKTLVSPFA